MALLPHPRSGTVGQPDQEDKAARSGSSKEVGNGVNAQLTPARTANQSKGKTVVCRVVSLDNTSYEIEISKSAVGQELFDAVVKERIHLEESAFFSLSFEKLPGTKFWLNMTKKIEKQLQSSQWVFFLEFKFYPPEPNVLSLDETRYQLVLQVRQDMLSGRLPCSFYSYAVLGSYTAQSELGDFDPLTHGKSIDYLRPYMLAPNQSDELLERVSDLHQLHKGMEPAEADLLFLNVVKKMALYGVALYKAKEQVKGGDQDVLVGVSPAGLYIYDGNIRMNTYKWPRIRKMSYKYNVFHLKTVFYEASESKEEQHDFKCTSPKLAKRLWRICVETHQFFRLKQSEPTDTNLLTFGTRRNLGLTSTLYQHRQQQEQGTIRKSRTTLNSSGNESAASVPRPNGSSFTSDQLLHSMSDGLQTTDSIEDGHTTIAKGTEHGPALVLSPPRSSTPDHSTVDQVVDERHAAMLDSSLHDDQQGLATAGDLLSRSLAKVEVDQLSKEVGVIATSVETMEEAADISAAGSASTVTGKQLTANLHNGHTAAEDEAKQLSLGEATEGAEPHLCTDSVVVASLSSQSCENAPARAPESSELDLPLPGFSPESFGISATGQLVESIDLTALERNEKFTTESNSSPADKSRVTITVADKEAVGDDDQALLDAIRSVIHLDLNLAVEKIELQADSNYKDV